MTLVEAYETAKLRIATARSNLGQVEWDRHPVLQQVNDVLALLPENGKIGQALNEVCRILKRRNLSREDLSRLHALLLRCSMSLDVGRREAENMTKNRGAY